MYKSAVTASTALSDTTEKLLDTLTVPGDVTKIIGIAGHACGGAGITTLENVTGKMRVRNASKSWEVELLLDVVCVLTGGVPAFRPTLHPVDLPVGQGDQIECYMTMDLAQTVANTGRVQLVYA